MFRSVLVIIFVIAVLWIGRIVLQRLQNKQPTKPEARQNHDTVQCLQCKTYIPKQDAILQDNAYFCSQRHLDDWNQSS